MSSEQVTQTTDRAMTRSAGLHALRGRGDGVNTTLALARMARRPVAALGAAVAFLISLVRADRSMGREIGRAVKGASCAASTVIAGVFLVHVFGLRQVVTAASGANVWLLLEAVALGALIQVVRARRSQWLLAQSQPVSLFHSYAAMVVGHGIGDLVPIAPGGPVLRTALTKRLTGIPIAFSSGVYLVEGMLDVIAPALLVPYLLITLSLPSWTHWALIGLGTQAVLLLVLLIVLAVDARFQSRRWRAPVLAPRFTHLAHQIADGLRAVTAGGARRCLLVVGLSLLLIALTAGQVSLFLHAFDIRESASGLLLLLVVMLGAGSVPVKIPAFGTLTAAAVLPVAGVHGPEVGGYLLTSQLMLSSETVVLATLVLGWWFTRGIRPLRGVYIPDVRNRKAA